MTPELLEGVGTPLPAARHIRALLVGTGVLPDRHELVSCLELWRDRLLEPPSSRRGRIIRPFAEWHVLRDA
ncbi:hypothetical protein GCM10020229_05110 [Kitasatospora albolonga]